MAVIVFLVFFALAWSVYSNSDVSPCRVQSSIIQPLHGISAKSHRLIDVLQSPPYFVQSVQVDLCKDELIQTGSTQNFVCRQRYRAVEVYVKGVQSVLPEDHILSKPFYEHSKDMILIEAGCEFFITYKQNLPITGGNNLPIASNSRFVQVKVRKNNTHRKTQVVRQGFYRQGLHLQSSQSQDAPQEQPSLHNETVNTPLINSSTETSAREETVLSQGEILLSPESLGPPIFIVEPEFDPIMEIISKQMEISL